MSWFGSVKLAVMALLSAALVTISPVATSPAQAAVVTLQGTISDAGGPAAGARVRVRAVGGSTIITSATANGAGFYSLSVEAGNYDLTFLGAPESGLLSRAPNTPVTVNSMLDRTITAQSITLTGALTAPYPNTPSGTTVTLMDGDSTLDDQQVDHGEAYSFLVVPGAYRLLVTDGGNTGVGAFGGYRPEVFFEEDTRIDVEVPVHSTHLTLETPGGSPINGLVFATCEHFDGVIPGWEAWSWTQNGTQINGAGDIFLASTNPGGTCKVTVQPETGVDQNIVLDATTTDRTVVIQSGIHLTGASISDGAGNTNGTSRFFSAIGPADANFNRSQTGRDRDSGAGFDIEVAPGQHSVRALAFNIGRYQRLGVDMALTQYDANTVVPVVGVPQTMTLNPVNSDGDPVPVGISLQCEGRPVGQTAVMRQRTTDATTSPTGEPFVVAGVDWVRDDPEGGTCTLTVTPTDEEDGVEFEIADFPFVAGSTADLRVDPGVTVSGDVTHPDIPSFTAGKVKATINNGSVNGAIGAVQPDGTYVVDHAPTGEAFLHLEGDEPAWGRFAYDRVLDLNGDVTGEDIDLQVDDLTVFLLDDDGDPATATVQLRCSGIPSGDPDAGQFTETTESGTGQVTLPGFSMALDGECQLETSFASGLILSSNVHIEPGGSTVTLIENGSVTLQGSPTATLDGDSVADALEAYAPNTGDGDDDGTPDYQQADVASLPENGGGLGSGEEYLTVEGPSASALTDVSTDDVTETADGSGLPAGLLNFTLTGVPDNSTQTVEIHLGSTAGINGYAVRNGDGTWDDMPANLVTITPTSIELTLKDNGPFDRDPLVGRIKHPGGGTKFDIEVPVINGVAVSEPNEKGWYKSNVTVRWTATDDKDPVANPANTVVSAEGGDVTATSAQVCDRRGNCGVGLLQHLRIDKTAPVVAIAGPVDGATYELGAVPARRCTATDIGGSGVPDQDCAVAVSGGNSGGIGAVTVAASGTDRAGNVARKSVSYRVVYAAGGLVSPSAGRKQKVFAKGSTVVFRVKIRDASGAAVTPVQAPVWVKPVAAGKAKTKPNQPVSDLKPDKGGFLAKRGQFWEFRWGTAKAKKGKAYVLTVRLDDGTTRTVTVGIG